MEVSALSYPAAQHRHARSPLLRLQSDETLIKLTRSGNHGAFEALVARYESRLLSFCRHLLRSHEDAEDVLQEVFSSAFAALHADTRPVNARPWLYRIARNRCLNHLRRVQPIGLDSMDVMFAEHGVSVAEKVEARESFRLLVNDIHELPETQRSALILRELEALSYEQIAEAMETTVPSVKSLLVRARVSLAEASEARLLSCTEVRLQLGEVAEGLLGRPAAPVRRHLRACERCHTFSRQLRHNNRALAALAPLGPLGPLAFWKLRGAAHAGASHSGALAGSSASGGAAAGSGATAAAVGGGAAGSGSGLVSAAVGVLATKTAAGIAAAVLVTAGAVAVEGHAGHVPGGGTRAGAGTSHHVAAARAPHPATGTIRRAASGRSTTPATGSTSASIRSAGAGGMAVHRSMPTSGTSVTLPSASIARPGTPGATPEHPLRDSTSTGRQGTARPAPTPAGLISSVAGASSAPTTPPSTPTVTVPALPTGLSGGSGGSGGSTGSGTGTGGATDSTSQSALAAASGAVTSASSAVSPPASH